MSFSKVHVIHVFQSIAYWQEEHISNDFDRRALQSVLWVVDFDHHLGDENPSQKHQQHLSRWAKVAKLWHRRGFEYKSLSLVFFKSRFWDEYKSISLVFWLY